VIKLSVVMFAGGQSAAGSSPFIEQNRVYPLFREPAGRRQSGYAGSDNTYLTRYSV
jgi:hypothetical protein